MTTDPGSEERLTMDYPVTLTRPPASRRIIRGDGHPPNETADPAAEPKDDEGQR